MTLRGALARSFVLVLVGSLAVAAASGVWAWYSGEGGGSVDVALAVPSDCPSFSAVDAHGVPFGDSPSAECSGSVLDFGIPAGAPGADGADGATGPAGPAGADSTVPGPTGPAGPVGATGPAGANGVSVTATESSDCRSTGRPGSAFASASGTTYACDGATGPQGPTGAQGPQGPQGAQGPQGPQGATGAQGPAGSNGVSGWVKVDAQVACTGGNTTCTTQANCPAGKKVTGGMGWQNIANPSAANQVLKIFRTSTINSDSGMEVFAYSELAVSGRNLILTIFCATVN